MLGCVIRSHGCVLLCRHNARVNENKCLPWRRCCLSLIFKHTQGLTSTHTHTHTLYRSLTRIIDRVKGPMCVS